MVSSTPLTLATLAACLCFSEPAQAHPTFFHTDAELTEALDSAQPWVYAPPDVISGFDDIISSSNGTHSGGDALILQVGSASCVIVGPGTARIWVFPRASRFDTPVAEMRIDGQPGVSYARTSGGERSDAAPGSAASYHLMELVVPAGRHTLTLPANTAAYGNYYDEFSFVPGTLVFPVQDILVPRVNVAFSHQFLATSGSKFTSTALPGGLTLDPDTGLLAGTPTQSGAATVTITATLGAASLSRQVEIQISSPLEAVTGQAGWPWRTSTEGAKAWAPRASWAPGGPLQLSPVEPGVTGAWLETDLTGPGLVEWDQTAQTGSLSKAEIAVAVDGTAVGGDASPPTWGYDRRRVWIPAGPHVLRWVYKASTVNGNLPASAGMKSFSLTMDTAPAASGTMTFQDWASATGFPQTGMNDDVDGDGVPNWAEFVHGPLDAGQYPVRPDIAPNGDWLEVTLPRRPDTKGIKWQQFFYYDASAAGAAGWSEARPFDGMALLSSTYVYRASQVPRFGPSPLATAPVVVAPAPKKILTRTVAVPAP